MSFFRTPTCTLHHHIGQATGFERGLNVSSERSAFEQQIEFLVSNYDIIDLSTLLSGKLPKRALLITFDDTYESVLDAARQILFPRRLPSVYFMNPELLDGNDCISLDRALAFAANTMGLERLCNELKAPRQPSVGALISEVMSKYGAAKRTEIRKHILTDLVKTGAARAANVVKSADLRRFAELGIEIGNHTATHVHCRSLSDNEIQTEIVSSRKKLEDLSGQKIRSFAMPYGHEDDLTPQVLKTLRDSGHQAIFLVHGRRNQFRPHKDVWYRVSLHNEKPDVMTRELFYLPLLRTIKKKVVG